MGMTFEQFDRALEGMEYGLRPSTYDELCDYSDELQETYTKPIEMTDVEYSVMIDYKERSSFHAFLRAINDLNLFEGNVFKQPCALSEQDLMRAWLHQEVIKVVE